MKWTVVVVIAAFWVLMMGLLFEREIRPFIDNQAPPTYRRMLVGDGRPQTVRMQILRRLRPAGMYTATFTPQPSGFCRLKEVLGMDVELGRIKLHTTTTIETLIDPEFQLAKFGMEMEGAGLVLRVDGVRLDRETLQIVLASPLSGRIEKTIPFEKDMVLSNDFSPFFRLPDLTPGREWIVHTLSPNLLQRDVAILPLRARVVERETIGWGEGVAEVTVHRVEVAAPEANGRVKYRVWVDLEGRVLQIEQGDAGDLDAIRLVRLPDPPEEAPR